MNLLQVGNTDLVGSRFNGFELHRQLRAQGFNSQYGVWKKESDDADTWEFARLPGRRITDGLVRRAETLLSVQSLLYPFAFSLPLDARFRTADIVHYQLVHTAHLGLAGLPLLTRLKPSVWTLHDPWALTGHCTHPFDCERWKTGCGQCPYLDKPMVMKNDHTAFMWRAKKSIYESLDVDLVVASRWMERMVKASPLTRHLRVHHIPFGVDLNVYSPSAGGSFRGLYGIPTDAFVVAFRASPVIYKNLEMIKESLRQWQPGREVWLLVFEGKGMLADLEGKYKIVEMGWVSESNEFAAAYAAADVFLMPSTAEAFGMMAIEAMACGTPVIVCDGTALPEVVMAPRGGFSVPQNDATAMAAHLTTLSNDSGLRLKMGAAAARLAREHYDFETYRQRTLSLYEEVIERRSKHGSH